MKFWWKLLILLLMISIIPIIALRTFGIHNVRKMAEDIIIHVKKKQFDDARHVLRLVMNNYAKVIGTAQEQVEMSLFYQRFEAKKTISNTLTRTCRRSNIIHFGKYDEIANNANKSFMGGKILESPISADPLQCFFVPSGFDKTSYDGLDCLNLMMPIYRDSAQYLGGLVVRQYLGLENGLIGVYPCPKSALNPVISKQIWYLPAVEEGAMVWSRPFKDPISDQMVMAASCPVIKEDENVIGVISLLVSLERLLDQGFMISGLPPATMLYLCTLASNSANKSVGAKILAADNQEGIPAKKYLAQKSEWLVTSDNIEFKFFLEDVARRKYNIRKMPFNGKMSFWAYGPLLRQGSAFVFIVACDQMLKSENDPLLKAIKLCLTRVEKFTAGFLVILIFLATAVAIGFSRTITKPLTKLTHAAKKLSGGNFEARVPVFSGEEFGNLARIFNSIGPRLKEHYCMRRSLEIAEEIEHNLLPHASPQFPGLDLYGMTLFSDETGGDYFDYLCVDEEKKEKLCIAVGDVTDHGIAAAILMTTVRGFLRLRATIPGTLGEIVSDINREFEKDVKNSGRFMTMFLIRVDRGNNIIEWVRAGHDPAILYDPDKDDFHRLDGGSGLPLGVTGETSYESLSCRVKPGQIIFIGTDGIWETRNNEGELFGKERLRQALRTFSGESARDIVLSVLDTVEEFRGDQEQEDDLTLVVAKITKK